MNLCAILVYYDHPGFFHATLDALQRCSQIQKTAAVLHSPLSNFSGSERGLVLQQPNLGYGAGINFAVRECRKLDPAPDAFLAINPDVQLSPQQVEALIQAHVSAGADCTFASVREKGEVIRGYRFSKLGTMRRVGSNAEFFPGTCFIFSYKAWEQCGGLDESYFHYFEDADFCSKLRNNRFRIHLADNVIIEHAGKSGVLYPETELPRYAVRNQLRFLQRLGCSGPLVTVNVALRHLLYLLRWRHGWKGIKQWYRGIGEFRGKRYS